MSRPVTDRQLANLRPVRNADDARDMAARRWSKKLGAPPADIDPLSPPDLPSDNNRDGAIIGGTNRAGVVSARDWDAIYVAKVYPDEWRRYYWQTYRELRRQYARGQAVAQYRLMTTRAAALATSIHFMETNPKTDKDLILRYDSQLRAYIQALQKYTEAEKHIISIQQEIMVTALTKVVGIAEATIQDLPSRAAFMRALEYAMSDEANARNRDMLTPLLTEGNPEQ